MMLNTIAPYNKIFCTIIRTLNKITTTSGIYFTTTHYFGIWNFWKLKIMHYNLWQKQKR